MYSLLIIWMETIGMSQQSAEDKLCKVMPLSWKRISVNSWPQKEVYFSDFLIRKVPKTGHLYTHSTPHVLGSLHFCLFPVWGQEIISTSLGLLLLPEHKHESQNVKENSAKPKSSHKGYLAGQLVIMWTLNKTDNKMAQYLCCWLKNKLRLWKFIAMLRKVNLNYIAGSCNIKEVWA